MLATPVGILNAGGSSGAYTFDLFFQDGTKAKFLRVGDVVTSGVTDDRYQITTWSTSPSDFASGGQVTATALDADVVPTNDSGFNSTVETPNQIDFNPAMQTSGTIGNISSFSGQDYEYQVQASWADNTESAKAVVGDRVVDSNGKEFSITFIDGSNRFGVPFRMAEVEKVGQTPSSGEATLYRPTGNYSFYQGTALSDPARTNIFNRDKVIIDRNLGGGGGGGQVTKVMQNTSGVTIPAGKPVAKRADGGIQLADSDGVSSQNYIGVANEEIAASATGEVTLIGPNIAGAVSGLGLAPGDDVFIGETAGEFVGPAHAFTGDNDSIIKVGVADCAAGAASATATDLVMFTEVVLRP